MLIAEDASADLLCQHGRGEVEGLLLTLELSKSAGAAAQRFMILGYVLVERNIIVVDSPELQSFGTKGAYSGCDGRASVKHRSGQDGYFRKIQRNLGVFGLHNARFGCRHKSEKRKVENMMVLLSP